MEFGDRPHIYNEFLDIMKNFKSQQIDTPGVIRSVSNLFMGNKKVSFGRLTDSRTPSSLSLSLPTHLPFPFLFLPPRPPANPPQPTTNYPQLVLGFNTFLPEGYKIELPLDGNGPPVAVYQAPGQTGVTRILGPGSDPAPAPSVPPSAAPAAAVKQGAPPPPQQAHPPPQPVQQQQQQQQQAPGGQPVEFDHAINYVTTIKKR